MSDLVLSLFPGLTAILAIFIVAFTLWLAGCVWIFRLILKAAKPRRNQTAPEVLGGRNRKGEFL